RSRPDNSVVLSLSKNPNRALENNIEVFPGDTIVVSKAGVVYVAGDVVRPGGFAIDKNDNLTVLQAIALAEGVKFTASLGKAMVIRKGVSGREEIPLNLKQI